MKKKLKKLFEIPYGARRRIRRGSRIKIFPTWSCNRHCSYCGNHFDTGTRPEQMAKSLTVMDWVKFILMWPAKVNEVLISGGEPTLYDGFHKLVNTLCDRGYLVHVLTNLEDVMPWYGVAPHRNLLIEATYHKEGNNSSIYTCKYTTMKSMGFNIFVKELDTQDLPYSRLLPFACEIESAKTGNKYMWWVGPDGLIFTNCFNCVEYYKRKGSAKVQLS